MRVQFRFIFPLDQISWVPLVTAESKLIHFQPRSLDSLWQHPKQLFTGTKLQTDNRGVLINLIWYTRENLKFNLWTLCLTEPLYNDHFKTEITCHWNVDSPKLILVQRSTRSSTVALKRWNGLFIDWLINIHCYGLVCSPALSSLAKLD